MLEDISGMPLKDMSLVGDHLKQDDSVYAYPNKIDDDIDEEKTPYIIDPKDLITTIKQAHYTTVLKLTEG